MSAGPLLVRIAEVCERVAEEGSRIRWPSPRWRKDPVAFFREVLGIEPWDKQIEVIEAIRDNDRVAVKSGHKVSKSNTGAGIALWFFASYEDARVIMTCVTARQINDILYREAKKLHSRSGLCVACNKLNEERRENREPEIARPCAHSAVLDGQVNKLAHTGIQSADLRQLVGFTAKEPEAVAGVSGGNLLYLVDEASGVDDEIFKAIDGNRAGGAKIAMFSNPTRKEGEFYEAFNSKSKFYKTITISSKDTPNYKSGRDIIPGLAGKKWVDEKEEEWGKDSVEYQVRVEGNFPTNEEGKIISLHRIMQAEQRWYDTVATGPLQIGLDVAGPGMAGDESVFWLRRGQKHVGTMVFRGLTEEAHLAHLLGILSEHSPRETALVVLDREGPIGYKVWTVLRAYAEGKTDYELVGIRASDAASREPHLYDRTRDELWASAAKWLKEGGSLIEDSKLSKELHAPSWHGQVNGKLKATDKRVLKKELGRSPDRADAMQLATWEVRGLGSANAPEALPAQSVTASLEAEASDPYDALSVWGRS